ncbi:MAG: hypothetical protein J1F11_08970 [Oscillospiraceae bacterium]|nr:hypothetical protein [Oscillospiraceae bacterium]
MKKLLSIVISIVIILGVLPITSFAASEKADVYGCSVSASAKQVCFVIGDEKDFTPTFLAQQYASDFTKYYYIPKGTVVDFKVIAEKLPGLQNLAVVSGEVKNLSALGEMKNLVWLGLYQNDGAENLSFLKKLPRLKKFRYVNIHGDKYCESIKPVSYLKNLTELYLNVSSTACYDLAPLKGLTGLKKLEIETAVYENLSVLGNMKNLQELDITTGNGVDPSSIGKLKNLKKLKITIHDEADMSFLGSLAKLESLHIHGNGTAKGLDVVTGLKGLKSLEIDGLSYGQQDLSFVGKMTWLESLDISSSNTSFTKNIGNLKGLKQLTLMDINNSLEYDMSFIKKLTGLEELFIMGHLDMDITGISKLKNLKKLSIVLSGFDDLSELKKCSSLEELMIYHCSTEFDVSWIAGTNIKEVYFSGDIENMDKLASLKKLEKITVDFTGISEDTVEKIKKALPDCRIEVYERGYEEYMVY